MTIKDLHTKAMNLADEADAAKFSGNYDEYINGFKQALVLERQAAFEARSQKVGEPTESILFRSAASMAMCCKEWREAEKLIACGLSGDAPDEIAEELRNLLEDVNFGRHLELKGISLQSNEIQLVIAGSGVGYGLANSQELLSRVDTFCNLATRAVERNLNKPFRKKGKPINSITRLTSPYISTGRAASFAVTLRFGELDSQQKLPGMDPMEDIIKDVATNIYLVNEGNIDELKNRITDPDYLSNFISLTKELAPDGDEINLVGITYGASLDNTAPKTQLTRTKKDFSGLMGSWEVEKADNDASGEQLTAEVRGVLSLADASKNIVKITSDKDKVEIIVPDGLSDIVRKYWDESVLVKYRVNNGKKTLYSIDPNNTDA